MTTEEVKELIEKIVELADCDDCDYISACKNKAFSGCMSHLLISIAKEY